MSLSSLKKQVKALEDQTLVYVRISIIFFCLIALVIYQNKSPAPTQNYTKRIQQEYMHDLIVTHFTDAGIIKDQIYANYWAYMPVIGNSALINPKMHLIKPSGAKWIIQAKHGKAWHATLESKISRLDLHEDVLIERLTSNEFVPITMQTTEISYFPETETIESAQFVEMKKPGFHLTGIGLKGDLTKDTMQLLNNVKTDYETVR